MNIKKNTNSKPFDKIVVYADLAELFYEVMLKSAANEYIVIEELINRCNYTITTT